MKLRRYAIVIALLATSAAVTPNAWTALAQAPGGTRPAARARAAARPAARAARDDDHQVLVRIGREAITRGDLQRRIEDLPEQFRSNYSTPEGRQQLVERMIEERVWMIQAEQVGILKRPQIARQMESQRRDLVIRAYVNEMMGANPAPSDSDARVYYDAHLADYRVPASLSVRHIQTRTEAEARRVLQWARGKQDWNKLVQRFSADTLTRATGGALGTATREGVFASIGAQPALAESAFALGEGKIGGPFHTDHGWHAIKVESVKLESTRPLDQVRPMILRQLASQRSQEYYKAKLDAARKSLGVTPDSNAIRGFVEQKKSARDMFREAQEAGPAAQRIDLYQRLLNDHPDSEVSPQAQFMIGFINSEELKNYDQAELAFRALLERYPKSELAASAQWMLDHMRSEDAPAFFDLGADSTGHAGAHGRAGKGGSGKP